MKCRKSCLVFLILTGINVLVFLYRDDFHYQPFTSYEELYQLCNEKCAEKWTQDNLRPGKKTDLQKAEKISQSFIPDGASEFQKSILITDHIYNSFGKRSGKPTKSFRKLPVLDQYLISAKYDSVKLWCGIFTGMISLFSSSHQIITRTIEIKVAGKSHMVSEIYLKSHNQWFLTDPTFGLLALVNENGKLLDLQTFRNHLRQNKKVFVLERNNNQFQYFPLNNQLFIEQYYKPIAARDFYFYHTSLQKAYSTTGKIKRYLLPVSWFEIYSNEKKSNFFFFIKLFFLLLWLVAFAIFIKYLRPVHNSNFTP